MAARVKTAEVKPSHPWEPKTDSQRKLQTAINTNSIVFARGPAGTGKTAVATWMALEALASKRVDGIVITRPAVAIGESFGFIPGTLDDKFSPFLTPVDEFLKDSPQYQSLTRRYDADEQKPQQRALEFVPVGFIRGRTFTKKFVLIDEAQNLTKSQGLAILTRLGEESIMVFTGDPTQSDLRPGQSAFDLMIGLLDGLDGVATIDFTPDDVLRHGLVKQIIKRFHDHHAS